ncbi:CoA pyrophosphatase [Paenarthrobacter sp. DKR-5]|uniref:NUDIX hydrolase n=1 Tax=Paenarthrobacter sp. DKR-5 TaxID=2835535 RepID=UPI0027DD723E|nr:CoA pyrophosphatase [Paenarthrobacter sp. DKR-5]
MTARAELAALADRAARGDLQPHDDINWRMARMDPATARRAAVLILFGVLDDIPSVAQVGPVPADLDLLLVQRADTLGSHPGQVAFPGGGIDPSDGGPVGAALREAVEETGLDVSGVDVLGELPQVGVPISNFLVTPVLGWWASPSPVDVVDYGESARVFRAPVRDLLDPARRRMAVVERGGRSYESPAFLVSDAVVWGFTGLVLNQLFDHLGWTRPWDSSRKIPAPL